MEVTNIKSRPTETPDETSFMPEEEAQVTVHCSFTSTMSGEQIRIWKTTWLTDRDSTHRSRLLHAENITLYPEWTPVEQGTTLRFTLIFSALPKGCTAFDLIEIIPQPGAFHIRNIKRNKSDVYRVVID